MLLCTPTWIDWEILCFHVFSSKPDSLFLFMFKLVSHKPQQTTRSSHSRLKTFGHGPSLTCHVKGETCLAKVAEKSRESLLRKGKGLRNWKLPMQRLWGNNVAFILPTVLHFNSLRLSPFHITLVWSPELFPLNLSNKFCEIPPDTV